MRSVKLGHRAPAARLVSRAAAPKVVLSARAAPRVVSIAAKRRAVDVDGYSFEDVFQSAGERIFREQGYLKKQETSILLASVESQQHALMALEMFAQHVKNVRDNGTGMDDWHFRKHFYTDLCLTALKIGCPDIIFRLFSDMARFDIAGSYFARDTIGELAKAGAGPDILFRVADMVRCQRPPGDKGAKAGLVAVVDALTPRGGPAVAAAEQALKAFKAHAAAAAPMMPMKTPVVTVAPSFTSMEMMAGATEPKTVDEREAAGSRSL